MLNIQLETFICVVESGSFTKAAEHMYLSPTAVMKRVNMLEAHIGFALFDRTAKGIVLTAAGESFYKSSKKIVQLIYDAVEEAMASTKDREMTICIGNKTGFPRGFVNERWPKIQKACQGFNFHFIHYNINEGDKDDMICDVGKRTDVLLDYYSPENIEKLGMKAFNLMDTKMECIISAHHPLAQKEKIALEDLRGRTVLLTNENVLEYFSSLKKELERYSDIRLETYSIPNLEILNRCYTEDVIFVGPESLVQYNPALRTVPLMWDSVVKFGIWYQGEPAMKVRLFLERLKELFE